MDKAKVTSIPQIDANDVDAAIIHEAAIGRINNEQLTKLRTLGMTEQQAEEVIIENGTHGNNLQADKEAYWANVDAFVLNNLGI